MTCNMKSTLTGAFFMESSKIKLLIQ